MLQDPCALVYCCQAVVSSRGGGGGGGGNREVAFRGQRGLKVIASCYSCIFIVLFGREYGINISGRFVVYFHAVL